METQTMKNSNGSVSNAQFVVTSDHVEAAGAVAYWRLGGATSLERLTNAWAHAGLSVTELPEAPSYKIALSRALRAQESPTRKLVKAAGFWALLDVVSDKDGNVTTVQRLKAKASEASIALTDTDGSDDAKALARAVQDRFYVERTQLAASDVSMWLTTLASESLATSLRESGGVYFLPQPAIAKWQTIANVLANIGHAVFMIPAMRSDEAVAAILDSITQEAEIMVRTVMVDLTQPVDADGTMGPRALTTKLRDCDAMASKIVMYENLLQTDLDGLQGKIDRLRKAVKDRRTAVENAADGVLAVNAALTINRQ